MSTFTEITVRNYHIDAFGHVNHARFVELLEEARWRYLEANALLEALHRVEAFHVVARIVVDYRIPARLGDVLGMETWVAQRSDHSFEMGQSGVLKSSGKTAIRATVTNAFVDAAGRPRAVDDAILACWPDLSRAPVRAR